MLELFLRESGHGNLIGTFTLCYFLLRGILCPKGTSSISFCRRREKMMILEAWSSDTSWTDFQSIESEKRLGVGFTCNKRMW